MVPLPAIGTPTILLDAPVSVTFPKNVLADNSPGTNPTMLAPLTSNVPFW
jgi:hypothetical protein